MSQIERQLEQPFLNYLGSVGRLEDNLTQVARAAHDCIFCIFGHATPSERADLQPFIDNVLVLTKALLLCRQQLLEYRMSLDPLMNHLAESSQSTGVVQ